MPSTIHQIYDVRISYDRGHTWQDLATEAGIFSWSPEIEPHDRQRQIFSLEPISFRIESTATGENLIAQLLGNPPAQLERTPPPRWPRGTRAAARQQRKRRAKQRQKRQRHA